MKIPRGVYEYLYDFLAGEELEENLEVENYLLKLKSNGFLKTRRIQVTQHPETSYLASYLKSKVTSMILQVTQNCNLRCEYCVYSGSYYNRVHSNKRMSWDIAKQGIDFLERHSSDCERVYISFYGGEPLLEYELIRKSIKYAEERLYGKKIYFNLTTNGTLLTKDIISFFQEHDLHMMISLDGPKNIHDLHRKFIDGKGSYDIIMQKLQMIREKFPDFYKNNVAFNTVLDPKNGYECISDFIVGSEFLNQDLVTTGIISPINSKGKVDSSELFLSEKKYDYFLMLLDKIGEIDVKKSSPLNKMEAFEMDEIRYQKNLFDYTELPQSGHHSGPCIPGSFRLFMSVEGKFFPCERISESSEFMAMGNVFDGFELDKVKRILNTEEYNQEQCHLCWAYNYCQTCVAEIELLDGLPHQSIDKCEKIRSRVENLFKDYCVLKRYGFQY